MKIPQILKRDRYVTEDGAVDYVFLVVFDSKRMAQDVYLQEQGHWHIDYPVQALTLDALRGYSPVRMAMVFGDDWESNDDWSLKEINSHFGVISKIRRA